MIGTCALPSTETQDDISAEPETFLDMLKSDLTKHRASASFSTAGCPIFQLMFPVFGDERKRKINLGGASSASTRSAILDQAQARRTERVEQKKRQDNAVKLQAWWRGLKVGRRVVDEMRKAFDADVVGITGLRCLVLIGRSDEEALGIWSSKMMECGPDTLFGPARSGDSQLQNSWLVLIKQACFLLLRSVSRSPLSQSAITHLAILNILLSSTATEQSLGNHGLPVTAEITRYLLVRDLYPLLAWAIRKIPVESRTAPSLPLLIQLTTLALETFAPPEPKFALALTSLFSQILTIPLLLYRIPSPSLTQISSKVPFSHLDFIDSTPFATENVSGEDKIHLIATLHVLIPPRYKTLPANALSSYLRLLTLLINATPISSLNHPEKRSSALENWGVAHDLDSDSDSESPNDSRSGTTISVAVVSSFSAPASLPARIPTPDARVLKRLATLPSSTHIAALLSCKEIHDTNVLPALVECLLALSIVWPAVLGTILATGAGLLREVYREYVRRSVLGKDADGAATLLDPKNSGEWPALLFLTDMYAQALKTMGDDEFFGSSDRGAGGSGSHSHVLGSSSNSGHGIGAVGTTQVQRNPLTLDELRAFSRQLLNIAFVLYWREDGGDVNGTIGFMAKLVGAGDGNRRGFVRCTWEGVREKVTRCLVGIHARDSRKPFVPPDHWLVTSQIDMQSFVEAAIFEEQQLSSTDSPNPPRRHSRLAQSHSKRQLSYLSPRLGVLNNIPFAIPFDTRVSIFRNFVFNDAMQYSGYGSSSHRPINPMAMLRHGQIRSGKTRVLVRRGSVAQDGFDRLAEADLKAPVEITFIDQFGVEEAGIDGGGVFKEFFTSLCKEVFDTDRGLWLANVKNELYPNPHAYATEGHSLNWYRFIGRILGKAMYEGILVDVAFAGFFLAKWLGRQSFLDDLASLDPDLYNGLIFLKHYAGNLEDLALNFTVAVDEFGVAKSVDLVPNGSNIAVTRENRLQYIYSMSHYRLSKQIKLQSEAFFEGLSEMIDPKWIRMFNQQEVQILLGGVNAPIDFDDLRTNTQYGGLYDDNEPTVVAFWNVVNSFNQEQRMALLRFVTSCSRPPLLGFKELVPNFSIRDAGVDQLRLPTASTCVNLLKLPLYKSEKVLREKLLQAITSNAGFDLS